MSVLRPNVESVLHFACRVVRLHVRSVASLTQTKLRAVSNFLSAHTDEDVGRAPASEQQGGDRPGNGEPKQQKRPQLPQPGCEPHAHSSSAVRALYQPQSGRHEPDLHLPTGSLCWFLKITHLDGKKT